MTQLPMEAYALALAELPELAAGRLRRLLAVAPAEELWCQIGAGRLDRTALAALDVLGRKQLARWRDKASTIDPAETLARYQQRGIGIAVIGTEAYPARLVDDIDPPAIVFSRGDPSCLGVRTVAMVGTRTCTHGGAEIAYELGLGLAAAGVCVVSGLALGIDGASHRGALHAQGRAGAAPPAAVVGSGIDVPYPRRHASLWADVARTGVVLSESPAGSQADAWRFPLRNRIIAALADVVVVVESHHRGGSMITVDEADRRGVDVMAVPGALRNNAAAGSNDLLAEGRAPVRDVDDVLIALGLTASQSSAVAERRAAPDDRDRVVLEAFEWQPVLPEHLAARTGAELSAICLALARLERDGWIASRGGWYERVADPAVQGLRSVRTDGR